MFACLLAAQIHAQTPDSSDAEEARARLETLEADIARITRQQRQREEQRSNLQKQLRESEQALGRVQIELQATETAITRTQDEISRLTQRRAALQSAARDQQGAVVREIRAAWKTGGNDELRLLLNEDDPQQAARLLAYYRYVLKARSALLDEYAQTLDTLKGLQADLQQRETQLAEQRRSQTSQQATLEASRNSRRTVIQEIEAALKTEAEQLADRQRDRAELEQVLAEIDAALAQLMPEDDVKPFSAAQGAMPWPVDGRITDRFGRPRNQGKMRWQGIRLSAEAGSTVAAIHHGRVVYADWLRGSGLLLVIDHGEGYLSLYAHNESLLREVGDWVSAGAPISTVGNSGGQSEPGLYFEIRKDGKPTDPQRWCRG